jgi:hypothetical protein
MDSKVSGLSNNPTVETDRTLASPGETEIAGYRREQGFDRAIASIGPNLTTLGEARNADLAIRRGGFKKLGQLDLRRRANAMPPNPRPSSAKVAGSGARAISVTDPVLIRLPQLKSTLVDT